MTSKVETWPLTHTTRTWTRSRTTLFSTTRCTRVRSSAFWCWEESLSHNLGSDLPRSPSWDHVSLTPVVQCGHFIYVYPRLSM